MLDCYEVDVAAAGPEAAMWQATRLWNVAIVSSHNLLRRGLAELIAAEESLRLVTTAAAAGDVDWSVVRPDVIVWGPSREADVDELRGLAEHGRVLVLVEILERVRLIDLLYAGAYGCVIGGVDDVELLRAVTMVASGGFHVSPSLGSQLREELSRSAAATSPVLGRREAETLRWIAAGLTHRQVANRMGLTESTVHTYVKRVREKLNAGNKAELTRIALELDMTERPTGHRFDIRG